MAQESHMVAEPQAGLPDPGERFRPDGRVDGHLHLVVRCSRPSPLAPARRGKSIQSLNVLGMMTEQFGQIVARRHGFKGTADERGIVPRLMESFCRAEEGGEKAHHVSPRALGESGLADQRGEARRLRVEHCQQRFKRVETSFHRPGSLGR